MKLLNNNSLYQTLDNLFEYLEDSKKLTASEKKKIAKWISDRHLEQKSYANMFAPTEKDYKGVRLPTGDKLTSKASIAHILGEESLRAMYLMDVKDKEIKKSISEARKGISDVVEKNYKEGNFAAGTYCCGKCTAAYWRNLSAEGVKKNRKILESGIRYLKSFRDGKGGWRTFPFYYTVLALTGIDLPAAREEIRYASGHLKKYSQRKPRDKFSKRKIAIAKKALDMSYCI